jgi:RteC protein.
MQIERINDLVEFVEAAREVINDVVFAPEGEKVKYPLARQAMFSNAEFDKRYGAFIEELNGNIKTCSFEDVSIYLESYLDRLMHYPEYDSGVTRCIINNGIQVEFFMTLKTRLEKFSLDIGSLLKKEQGGFHSGLCAYMDRLTLPERIKAENAHYPDVDPRFEIENFQQDISRMKDPVEIVRFVTERMFEFDQWRLINDRDMAGQPDNIADKYYPDFTALCVLEIKKQQAIIKLSKPNTIVAEQPLTDIEVATSESLLRWKASQTDLIELLTSLHEHNAIERRDGKELTRKELLNQFQSFFGFEIKDAESLLSRATERATEKAPFLVKLRKTFHNYCDRKL